MQRQGASEASVSFCRQIFHLWHICRCRHSGIQLEAGAWQESLELLFSMLLGNTGDRPGAVLWTSDRSRQHLQPNTICFNAAISACERSGRWDIALQLLHGMPLQAGRLVDTTGQFPQLFRRYSGIM